LWAKTGRVLDHRVNDNAITGQAFVDVPGWQRRTPLLKRFLSRADEIVEHVSQKENLLSAKKREIGAA
jgi:hypothetical protein